MSEPALAVLAVMAMTERASLLTHQGLCSGGSARWRSAQARSACSWISRCSAAPTQLDGEMAAHAVLLVAPVCVVVR